MRHGRHVRMVVRISSILVVALALGSCLIDAGAVFGPTGIVQSHPARLLNQFTFEDGLNDSVGSAELLFSGYATRGPTDVGTALTFVSGDYESASYEVLLPLVQYRLNTLPSQFSVSFWAESVAAATSTEHAYSQMEILLDDHMRDPTGIETRGNETAFTTRISVTWDSNSNNVIYPLSVRFRHDRYYGPTEFLALSADRYFVVVTYDAEDVSRIYVNGVLVDTARNQTVQVAVPAEPIWVVVGWNGIVSPAVMDAGLFVDDLRFYDGALRHDEVRVLFEEGPQ